MRFSGYNLIMYTTKINGVILANLRKLKIHAPDELAIRKMSVAHQCQFRQREVIIRG